MDRMRRRALVALAAAATVLLVLAGCGDDGATGGTEAQNGRPTVLAAASLGEVQRSLEFFMGKNTPERREFIVNNLVAEAPVDGQR